MLDNQKKEEVEEIRAFYDSVYYADAKPSASRSLLRHYARLHQRMGLRDGSAVLDVACGLGEWLKVCDPMQNPLPGEDSWAEMERVYYNP